MLPQPKLQQTAGRLEGLNVSLKLNYKYYES